MRQPCSLNQRSCCLLCQGFLHNRHVSERPVRQCRSNCCSENPIDNVSCQAPFPAKKPPTAPYRFSCLFKCVFCMLFQVIYLLSAYLDILPHILKRCRRMFSGSHSVFFRIYCLSCHIVRVTSLDNVSCIVLDKLQFSQFMSNSSSFYVQWCKITQLPIFVCFKDIIGAIETRNKKSFCLLINLKRIYKNLAKFLSNLSKKFQNQSEVGILV